MKKAIIYLLALLVLGTSMQSCMTTKTPVGNFRESTGEEYMYAKGKQLWLFWGIVPIGRTSVATPTNGSCEVITRFNFGDFLISGLTLGVVTSQSIKIKAKR